MMAAFLAVPLKQGSEVDLIKPLRSFIENTFSSAQPDDYKSALTEFNKLRNSMVSKSAIDKQETSLEVFYRYYDQLNAIENKLPITENQIRVQFKWRDAFDKDALFSGKRTLAIASGAYEKVCVLYNMAALQSQIASIQNDGDVGLKLSAKLFQQACGIYGHLKDVVMSAVQNDPTPDLNPDTLNALAALMLAQAQESFFRKSTADRMKEVIIAKIANQCADLYADALKLLQNMAVKTFWPKDWLSNVAMKQAGYHGLAEYYQSIVSQNKQSYGEEIARLQHAVDLMNGSNTRSGGLFTFKTEMGKMERALASAKKDNDFIYHDKVPDIRSLPAIGKAAVAKPLAMTNPMGSSSSDLFDKLVPLPVHEALTAFENRKSQIVNNEVGRMREKTQLLNSVLASLNLPAAIEDLGGDKLPQSVTEKAAKVQEAGGLAAIESLMAELPELLTRNRDILNVAVQKLDEEESSDTQLREQFKERWTRKPSGQLTQPMRAETAKYSSILDTAVQADHIVKEKYDKHKNAIQLLSKPLNQLESSLPSANPAASLKNNPVVQSLRKLMDEVDGIKAERDVIESEVKDAKFDMASKFMQALVAEGLVNEEALSTQELDRVYEPLRLQVSDSIHRQEILLNKVQGTNTEFCKAKASNQTAAQRENMLKDLAAGYDVYMDLRSNLKEGTKFYDDLTPLLLKLQNKFSDFCFARKTEKDELLKDLQVNIANQTSQPPPPAPKYQQPDTQAQGNKVPPPRPPPPTIPAGTQPYGAPAAQAPSQPPAQQTTAPPTQGAPPAQPPPTQGAPPAQPPAGATGGAPQYPPGAWGQTAPYPQYGAPAAGGGYPAAPMPSMPMPTGYNPYSYGQPNPYAAQQQQYPQQGYPQQPPPAGYPQQQYPGQPPQQQYPNAPPYPQQQQWR